MYSNKEAAAKEKGTGVGEKKHGYNQQVTEELTAGKENRTPQEQGAAGRNEQGGDWRGRKGESRF